MPGASAQDELQSFGLEADQVDRGHLSALEPAVHKLQLVGFLKDLKTCSDRRRSLHDLTGVVMQRCAGTDLLSSCSRRDVLFQAERDGHVPQLLLQSLRKPVRGQGSSVNTTLLFPQTPAKTTFIIFVLKGSSDTQSY